MTLHVHFDRDWGEEWTHLLRSRLSPEVEVTFGPDLPARAVFEILVSGNPDRELLASSPALRAVVVPWAGVSKKTIELLADFPQVALHNIHHNAAPTAEMALAHLLAAAKQLLPCDRALRRGDWRPRTEAPPAFFLGGKTALLLGYGAVARRLAPVLGALGMEVLAIRRSSAPTRFDGGVEVHPPDALGSLLPRAHVVFVCLPATEETDGFLGAKELDLLPSGAILVNVGRGRIVAEKPLYDALASGRLFAAGLDVWYNYPTSPEEASSTSPGSFPFGDLDNVVMSPHRAGHVAEDPALRTEHLARLLNAAARGEAIPGRVDLEAGY